MLHGPIAGNRKADGVCVRRAFRDDVVFYVASPIVRTYFSSVSGKGTIEAPEKIFCAGRIPVTGKPAFQGYQRFYLLRRTEVSSLHGVYRPPVSILSQTPGVSIAFSST